jgi:hypothetical protein
LAGTRAGANRIILSKLVDANSQLWHGWRVR